MAKQSVSQACKDGSMFGNHLMESITQQPEKTLLCPLEDARLVLVIGCITACETISLTFRNERKLED